MVCVWKMARFILLSVVLCPILAIAGDCQKVSEKELSTKLNFYRGLKELKVDFDQNKSIKDLGVKLQSKGNLLVRWPDQVVWRITSPSPLEFSLNSSKIKITSKSYDGSDRVESYTIGETISKKDAKGLMQLVLWLRLDVDSLLKSYTVCRKNSMYRFSPIDEKGSVFDKLDMSLRKSGDIKSLQLYEKSGDLMSLDFSRPKIIRK